MILNKKKLDEDWIEMMRYCRDVDAAKAEILELFSTEPDNEHQWTEQYIYEQIRKIIRNYE